MVEYIKLFDNHSQYEEFKQSEDFVKPNVSACIEENDVHYSPITQADFYLTFVATESGTFKLSDNSVNYSLDNGETWTALADNTDSPTVNAGDKILWKATLRPASSLGIGKFSSTANFTVEGNPMSLLYGDDFKGKTDLTGKNYAFYRLFSGCTRLASAENLSLPATKLASNCYQYMFNGCTSLTIAPELPATTLASNCYQYMFRNCSSLTTAPELPATTLAISCYSNMFCECRKLTTAPELPATTLAPECYSGMFLRCDNLTTAPELPVTTLADFCYYYMFSDCYRLTTAPELPATTLADKCYRSMFEGCRSLTTAPELPATTLAEYCYYSMFQKCSGLTSIKCLATDISASYCTKDWVASVSSIGTFTKAASMNDWTSGVNGIPNGWTVVDA